MEQVKAVSSKQLTFLEWLLQYNFSKLLGRGSQTLKKAAYYPDKRSAYGFEEKLGFMQIEFADGKRWDIDASGNQWPHDPWRKSLGYSIVTAYFDSVLITELDARVGKFLKLISVDYFENDPYMKALLSNENFVLLDYNYFMESRIEATTTYKIVEGFLVREQSVSKNEGRRSHVN